MKRLLLVLALLGFAAQVQSLSAAHRWPRWDEVQYLSLARDYAREGGTLAVIRCHFQGRCREDIRHPLYEFLLQAVVDDQPRSFARAKLITFGTALALLATIYLLVRRRSGEEQAVTSVALLSLSATLVTMSASLVHDVLFSALIFASVYAVIAWFDRPWAFWLLTGALIGLAYLAKGIGYLAFLPLVATGVWRQGPSFLRRGAVYAAVAGFCAVALFLLWRNSRVYGYPLHNFSIRAAWIDRWEDVWTLSRSPEWSQVGMAWYLRNHTTFQLARRMLTGFGITVGMLIYSAGLITPQLLVCVPTGAAAIGLSARGGLLRWRQGSQVEVFAVLSTLAVFIAAFSFGAQAGLTAPRYLYPVVLLLVPWTAAAIHDLVPNPLLLQGTAAALLAARLLWFGAGLLQDPRSYAGVPPGWRETSTWFSQHLRPGEQFALPFHSLYSTWDAPHPDTDPRWSYSYRTERSLMERHLDEAHVGKILTDSEDEDFATYQDRFSAERDQHGPLRFLEWPRCFADSGTPSRFLVFCKPGG